MPQFDINVWPPQLIWLIISFTVLYLLMARKVLPRISDVLEERDHKINDALRKADLLKEDAEAAYAAYEKTMAEARAGAQESLRGVRERVAADAAERNAVLSERLAKQTGEAEAEIARERAKALEGIADAAAEIAMSATQRLAGLKITKKAAGSAVAAAAGPGDLR